MQSSESGGAKSEWMWRSLVRVPLETVSEAEIAARALEVQADYAGRLDIANLCNELLLTLAEKNQSLPDVIRVDATLFAAYFASQQIPARSLEGELHINPEAGYWKNPIRVVLLERRANQWSTDHALHPLFHEAGHFVHYKADRGLYAAWNDDDITPRQKTTATFEVSKRSVIDLKEFISEVYAMLLAGRKVPRGIINVYRKKGGIEP